MSSRAPLALLLGVLVSGCGGHSPAAPAPPTTPVTAAGVVRGRVPSGDWPQFGYGSQRSGVGPADTGINAGNVRSLRRRTVRVDGVVDGPAIELHAIGVRGRPRDVVVVTTTYGRTIALDAGTGARLWEFVPADIGSYQGGHQVTTASPVADPDRRYVYAASPDGRLHKLAIATGRELRSGHWPVRATLDPTREKLASPATVLGRSLILVTGGYFGDALSYQGHVLRIDRASGRIEAVFNALCSNRRYLLLPASCPASDAAIWGRAGAVVEPGSDNIVLATGNGPFNGATDWGDSVLELSPDLRLLHNWTPVDQAALEHGDADLGSTSPALLPAAGGARLAVQGGKSGKLSLLDLNVLDGTRGPAGRRLGGELQQLPTPGGSELFSAPAVWRRAGRTWVFAADASGTTAYVLGADRRLRAAWSEGTAGTSPVLAGGLLYVYDHPAGRLVIRRPVSGRILAVLAAAPGHWESPIVVGGRVVLPEGGSTADDGSSGTVDIYHLAGR